MLGYWGSGAYQPSRWDWYADGQLGTGFRVGDEGLGLRAYTTKVSGSRVWGLGLGFRA